tara:strand:- start:172 stop:1752 length:1581 start_codon:yes stop_codon:yes gene_type:complete
MKKHIPLALFMASLLAVGLHAAQSQVGGVPPSRDSPNIIFIITDDHGYNDLEATDLRGEVDMPHIDRLSNGGALMTQAYCTAPQCVPSRAGIVTGRYQQVFGLGSNGEGPLRKTQTSIASRLKGLGYITGHVGKWHLDPNRSTKRWFEEKGYQSMADVPAEEFQSFKPQGFGYDEAAEGTGSRYWSNFDVHGNSFSNKEVNYASYEGGAHQDKFRLQLQTELAQAFINRHANKEEPFFLYLAYYGPHSPLSAPASLTDQVLSLSDLEKKGYDNKKLTYKKGTNYAEDYTQAEVRQQGLALLKGIDNGVGDIYRLLKEKGELENTLIFFMADNGAPSSPKSWDGSVNDPWHGSKGIIFEGGSRIPYIVHWKGVIEPQVLDKGVITLDAGATAVALAGGDPAADSLLDGVNLMPYLKGEKTGDPHRYLYQRYLNTASVVQGKLKYMRHDNGEELLFDLTMETPGAYNPKKDLHEKVNLIATHPEKAAEMREALKRWMRSVSPKLNKKGYHDSLIDFGKKRWGLREGSQ